VSGLGDLIVVVAEAASGAFPEAGGSWKGVLFWMGLTMILFAGALWAFAR
jgi:hypothetical protein